LEPQAEQKIIEDLLPQKFGLRGKIWVVFLVILCIAGIAGYVSQLRKGLIVTAMGDYVSWGIYISTCIFCCHQPGWLLIRGPSPERRTGHATNKNIRDHRRFCHYPGVHHYRGGYGKTRTVLQPLHSRAAIAHHLGCGGHNHHFYQHSAALFSPSSGFRNHAESQKQNGERIEWYVPLHGIILEEYPCAN
jgi:hypothetical protein